MKHLIFSFFFYIFFAHKTLFAFDAESLEIPDLGLGLAELASAYLPDLSQIISQNLPAEEDIENYMFFLLSYLK